MRLASAAALLLLAVSPALARLRVERLGPLRVRGVQPSMAGPFETRSIEFERTVLLRSLSVRLLDADGKPDPDQSHLCHLSLTFQHIMPQLVTLDLGTPRMEMPAGYGLRLEAGQRYLLQGMLLSDDPATDRTQTFEVTFDVVDEGSPGAPRPLVYWPMRVRPEDAGAAPAQTQHHDWLAPPGRRRFARTIVMPSTMTVRAVTVHVHRYASDLSIAEAATRKVLWAAKVERAANGVLKRTPSWSGAEPLVLRGGREYTLSVGYDNTSREAVPAMGVFYFFSDPPAP